MSLKAKVEAVVYASEEPVTLAQLASLFAADVPVSQQDSLPSTPAVDPEAELPLVADVDEGATGEDAPLDPATGEPEASALPSEVDGKRAARQRDREVRDALRGILDELIAEYAAGDRGIEIREIAGGYRFATKPECHDAVRGFVKRLKPPMKLTLQALETLAVIAYKQPVTVPEVSEIRGVDSAGVLGSLMARKLITTAGRKQVIGRPILYKTTKEFLLRFGLRDLAELPSIEEFEKMAGELAETDEAIEAGERELPFGEEQTMGADQEESSSSPEVLEEAVEHEIIEQETIEVDRQ